MLQAAITQAQTPRARTGSRSRKASSGTTWVGSEPPRATKHSAGAFAIATELGSARSRSGCRDGAIPRILGSRYHRNARKQSERGVPPNVTCPWRATRQRLSFFAIDRYLRLASWISTARAVPVSSTRRRTLRIQPDALRACRLSDAATANLSSSRRIGGGSKCVSRPESDAAPSALETG